MRIVFLLLALAGCGGSGGGGGDAAGIDPAKQRAVLGDFGAKVVIPTYEAFSAKASALGAAVTAFKAARTAENLAALRDAWAATRTPWEQSEAFVTYGPAKTFGLDGAVDSWPVNQTDLTKRLNDGTFTGLANEEKGFHTVEFLIFGVTSDKKADAFTDREIEYLTSVTASLVDVADSLAKAWKEGIEGQAAFATTIGTAGDKGNASYPSLAAGMQEMVEGMADICNEVANGKIANPFDTQDPNVVESQFSFNSLKDFADNMRSVQNVYLAKSPADGSEGASISALVAASDAALDKTVRAQIDAAIAAILAIPEVFPKSMLDPANAATIKAAQEAIRALRETLVQHVEPLVAR